MSHLQTLPDTEQGTVGKGTRQRSAHSEGRQLVRETKDTEGLVPAEKRWSPL